mgnify:CR=1 FL=1
MYNWREEKSDIMKTFIAFVRKEILHILRDRRTLLILIGMPIVQVLLFGFAVTNEFKDANMAVLDLAKDDLSKELTVKLAASGHFTNVGQLDSYSAVHEAFKTGEIKLAVVIPGRFSADFFGRGGQSLQLIAEGTEPNTATSLINYASSMIAAFSREKSGITSGQPLIDVESRLVYNPELRSTHLFVPGVITLVLMLVSAMMTSLTIAREKELGTMELLLVSPLPPPVIILGKVTPYVGLSFINAVTILLMGKFIFKVPLLGSIGLLAAVCLLFIGTALALGIFISTRTQTQQAAMLSSLMILMMPTILLSGFIFPVESMPLPLQVISNAIPAKYFILLLKDIMLKGGGIDLIWKDALVLTGMMLFLLVASFKNFKIRLG